MNQKISACSLMMPNAKRQSQSMKESKSRTQEQRREESVYRMLQAAIELIAEKGVAGLTMAEVGIKAGYSRGLAHLHFGSKDKLLSECLRYLSRDFNVQRKKDGVDTTGIRGIYSLVDAYTRRPEDAVSRIRAMFFIVLDSSAADSPLYSFVHDYNEKNMAYAEFKLNEAKALGQIKQDVDTRSAAFIIMSLLRGISVHRLNDPTMNALTVKEEILRMMHKWLAG
ncbi:TetR/AcrR family transcriptional regulator [Alicycliphilus denitrificans]|uniref:TetR/AcrR family transcriptional regulator n=1 Tax=Alicycliphilus denitrificans TaxID=179636 RepID=UPI001F399815|nr:TetR/AcrR family transcriptional regulator [Alicycliphilus denitrificans]